MCRARKTKTLRSFLELDPVAGLHAQRLQDASGKCDLALGGNLDEHGGDLPLLTLPERYIGKVGASMKGREGV